MTSDPAPTAPIDLRTDPLTGSKVIVVGSRQGRPNLPSTGCPFCVGGLESPEPYTVRSFKNRWPALPPGNAEVVLYSSEHGGSLGWLSRDEIRSVIDLWADRYTHFAEKPGVEYTLIFENRGPEVGATIAHPHGQIYAFDEVPPLPAKTMASNAPFDLAPERVVVARGPWTAAVPNAPEHPVVVRIGGEGVPSSLPELSSDQRDSLAAILQETLQRIDCLYDATTPYMMWIHQRPHGDGDWPNARLMIEIASPWRAKGVMRFVAAGELGAGMFFNPVVPEDVADRLRSLPLPLKQPNHGC